MKVKAPSRLHIEGSAGAPVERQETTGFAGGRRSHLGSLDDGDFDPAATEEKGGAGAEHAASANHNAHDFSRLNQAFRPEPILKATGSSRPVGVR
jgi:hypothetical protein